MSDDEFPNNCDTDADYFSPNELSCYESGTDNENDSFEDEDEFPIEVGQPCKLEHVLKEKGVEKLETFVETLRFTLDLNTRMRDKLLQEQESLRKMLHETVTMKKNLLLSNFDREEEEQQQNDGDDAEAGTLVKGFLTQFRMPYFKDADKFPCPFNRDHKRKKENKELITHEIHSCTWNEDSINALTEGVKRCLLDEHRESRKRNPLLITEKDYKAYLSKTPLEEVLKNNPDRGFDWMKISALHVALHTPSECRKMWHLYVKPSLKKGKWSGEESKRLECIAQNYGGQNWNMIATELCTGRSALQCFIHFRTKLNTKNSGKWTKEEDTRLNFIIQDCRHGNFIHWPKVSYYMVDRSLTQIYNRWNNNLAPHLKKGMFSAKEDQIIMTDFLVNHLGPRDVAAKLGNRSAVQVRERFHYQLKGKLEYKQGDWTLEEDQMLMSLVNKYGISKWSQIAKDFKTRNRTQIRHRYSVLNQKMSEDPNFDLTRLKRLERQAQVKKAQKTEKMFKALQSGRVKSLVKKKKRKKTVKTQKRAKMIRVEESGGDEASSSTSKATTRYLTIRVLSEA